MCETCNDTGHIWEEGYGDDALIPCPDCSKGIAISREEVITKLKKYFINEFLEDFPDGSVFDCDVLDTLDVLGKRWGVPDEENET